MLAFALTADPDTLCTARTGFDPVAEVSMVLIKTLLLPLVTWFTDNGV
jgi:hypothetical protein